MIDQINELKNNEVTFFDPASHTYWRNGERVYSVTQILRNLGDVNYDPAIMHLVERKRELGTIVHNAIDAFEKDGEWMMTKREDVEARLRAYIRFRNDVSMTNLITERWRIKEVPVVLSGGLPLGKYWFGCIPDIECMMNGMKSVIEIKCSYSPEPWHPLQTAAQAIAVGGILPSTIKRYALYLKPDGTYKLKEHSNSGDFSAFVGRLMQHEEKRISGKLKESEDLGDE